MIKNFINNPIKTIKAIWLLLRLGVFMGCLLATYPMVYIFGSRYVKCIESLAGQYKQEGVDLGVLSSKTEKD